MHQCAARSYGSSAGSCSVRADGHSSFNITIDVYGHLIPNAKHLLDEVESLRRGCIYGTS